MTPVNSQTMYVTRVLNSQIVLLYTWITFMKNMLKVVTRVINSQIVISCTWTQLMVTIVLVVI